MNLHNEQHYIPWIEKYRPNDFSNIVLSPLNRKLLENIIKKDKFPNLLFYGPPGTGKTTAIINLINEYQKKHNQIYKDLMIHLNASDERGIDIIRNQIQQFVNSKNLFHKGLKFVILDEVDYMTKNAQQALRYLIMNYSRNVRFCLICNYISKIDEPLQNEFIHVRFNKLPENEINRFLKNILDNEDIKVSDTILHSIQQYYKSDIRSMINYIQSHSTNLKFKMINANVWNTLYKHITTNTIEDCKKYIIKVSNEYNMGKKNIIKDFLNYIVHNNTEILNTDILNTLENIIHFQECPLDDYINYTFSQLIMCFPKL